MNGRNLITIRCNLCILHFFKMFFFLNHKTVFFPQINKIERKKNSLCVHKDARWCNKNARSHNGADNNANAIHKRDFSFNHHSVCGPNRRSVIQFISDGIWIFGVWIIQHARHIAIFTILFTRHDLINIVVKFATMNSINTVCGVVCGAAILKNQHFPNANLHKSAWITMWLKYFAIGATNQQNNYLVVVKL